MGKWLDIGLNTYNVINNYNGKLFFNFYFSEVFYGKKMLTFIFVIMKKTLVALNPLNTPRVWGWMCSLGLSQTHSVVSVGFPWLSLMKMIKCCILFCTSAILSKSLVFVSMKTVWNHKDIRPLSLHELKRRDAPCSAITHSLNPFFVRGVYWY